jgi:hypothetical protein
VRPPAQAQAPTLLASLGASFPSVSPGINPAALRALIGTTAHSRRSLDPNTSVVEVRQFVDLGSADLPTYRVTIASSAMSRSTASSPGEPYHHAWRRRPGSGTDKTTFIG